MRGEVVGGRYRLEERLGVGAMSEVWAALDLELDRRVALKLMAASADRLRFEREARAAAGLSHPNVCGIWDYGEDGERRYIAFEYLPGGTLEDRLSPGEPLADEETARIAADLAAALAHAHAEGILHRDLKPSNVIFDEDGNAKLADFGIARIGDASTLTEAGTMLGTAAYISPEQARAEPVTAATDVYAFGVILYLLLTGRLPFEAEQPLELALMHVNQEPTPIFSLRPDAPPALERVATWSLAKAPEDRPQDGAALVAALGQGGPVVSADETLVLPVARRRVGPRHVAAGVALGLLAAAGVAAAFLATAEPSEAPVTPSERRTTQRATTSTSAPPPTPPATTTTKPETTTAKPETTTTTPPPAPQPSPTPPPPPPPPPEPAPPPPPPTETVAPPPPPPPTEPVTTEVGTTTTTPTP